MEVSEKINWEPEYSIGNQSIDNDHKIIVDAYNDLVDILEQNGSRLNLAEVLSVMTDYVQRHFKREEQYMKTMNYPLFEEHKKMHRDYIVNVAMLNNEMMTTWDHMSIAKQLIHFLRGWWIDHILKKDTEYEKFKESSGNDTAY
jgi:hemerythrin-like metal-binding protein